MKKKGLAGGLLLALLLSACSKGVDVPGTTPRDRAERDERGEAAEDSREEEPAEAAEDSREEEPAGAAEDGSAQQEEAP